MLLNDEERFAIILASIRDYKEGENDIPILIVQQLTNQLNKKLINSIDNQIDTQEILDETLETYDFYNEFIEEKNINLKTIESQWYDLVELYLNEIVEGIKNV
jgi:hypothetical protein